MPCYDSRNDPAYVREEALAEGRDKLRKAQVEWTHNSPVAELLCSTLKQLSPFAIGRLPHEVRAWWIVHQERDAEKARKEAKKEAQEQAAIRQQIAELQKRLK